MTFLPIVERELRVASRRKSTHWLRFVAALSVLLIWMFIIVTNPRNSNPARLGFTLFAGLAVLAFVFTAVAGVFLTADALSSEKREGTLGLLFLTDLKGYDIVLGKLAAHSLHAIYGLLAVFPVLALTMLLGGVAFTQFVHVLLALGATLMFSLALGLLVSALSRETGVAMLVTFLLLLGAVLVLPAFCALLEELHWVKAVKNPLAWFSPFFVFFTALTSGRGGLGDFHFFVTSLVTLFSVALIGLWLACWRLPRCLEEKETRSAQTAPAASATGFEQRSVGLAADPFLWLAARKHRFRSVAQASLIGLVVPWGILFLMTFNKKAADFAFAMSMFGAFVLHALAKCLIAVEASRRFNEDRASGALELLLTTRLTPEAILLGQKEALRRFSYIPAAVCLGVNVALLWLLNFPDPAHIRHSDYAITSAMLIGGTIVWFTDYAALCWLGMEMGLRHSRHHRAVFATIGRIMIGPWLAIFLCFLVSESSGGPGAETFIVLICLWCAASAFLSARWGRDARRRLETRFRKLAAGGIDFEPIVRAPNRPPACPKGQT